MRRRPDYRVEIPALLRSLVQLRSRLRDGDDDQAAIWKQILELCERSFAMEAVMNAFKALVEDTAALFDPGRAGYSGSAVAVTMERDGFGAFSAQVRLSQIDGGQLSFVLDVARRFELDVREDSGWLVLSPHFIAAEDGEKVEEPSEAGVS